MPKESYKYQMNKTLSELQSTDLEVAITDALDSDTAKELDTTLQSLQDRLRKNNKFQKGIRMEDYLYVGDKTLAQCIKDLGKDPTTLREDSIRKCAVLFVGVCNHMNVPATFVTPFGVDGPEELTLSDENTHAANSQPLQKEFTIWEKIAKFFNIFTKNMRSKEEYNTLQTKHRELVNNAKSSQQAIKQLADNWNTRYKDNRDIFDNLQAELSESLPYSDSIDLAASKKPLFQSEAQKECLNDAKDVLEQLDFTTMTAPRYVVAAKLELDAMKHSQSAFDCINRLKTCRSKNDAKNLTNAASGYLKEAFTSMLIQKRLPLTISNMKWPTNNLQQIKSECSDAADLYFGKHGKNLGKVNTNINMKKLLAGNALFAINSPEEMYQFLRDTAEVWNPDAVKNREQQQQAQEPEVQAQKAQTQPKKEEPVIQGP